jgi:hypothetical protein
MTPRVFKVADCPRSKHHQSLALLKVLLRVRERTGIWIEGFSHHWASVLVLREPRRLAHRDLQCFERLKHCGLMVTGVEDIEAG